MAFLETYGIYSCLRCPSIYTSQAYLDRHLRDKHSTQPAVAAAAAPAAAAAAPQPPPPAHASHFTSNLDFFTTLPPDSPGLDEVHGQALERVPAIVQPLLDAVLSDFLAASLRRPNYDPPISAIYAFPRLLLAPPPPNTCRSSIVSILRGRITQLANGGAQALWASHPWLQTLPAATDFSATCPARAAARMSSAATVKSPSAVYRSLSTPAFLPPTPHTRDLLLSLFPRQYNPDTDPSIADSLPSAADLHLPRPPFPSGFIYHPTERKGIIAAWSRHLATHPTGQPDGTGLRGSLLTLCVSSLPLLCLWLQQLYLHHTTAAHRRRLASKTLNGQVKPDKQTKLLPTTASDATAARPLARHAVIRRFLAGFLSSQLTPHFRQRYRALNQYGLIPNGIESAPRIHQLHHDLRPPDLAHAALDVVNAHTSIARLPIFRHALQLFAHSRHRLDYLAAQYTLAYYSFPGTTLIQVGGAFEVFQQTDAIDQGEAMAQHNFGITFALTLAVHLTPRCPTLLLSLIHDDTTLADRTFLPSTPSSPPPAAPDPHLTPLPYAIAQLADVIGSQLRLSIAPHKTLLFQPPLPAGDSRALANMVHLFPTDSRLTDKSFVLAGCPVGTRTGIALTLVNHLQAFHTAVRKLLVLPGLHMQLRLLVLNLCCRPSSSFAHLLRHLPPTATASSRLPLPPLALPPTFPDAVRLSFAHHLRRITLDAIANCLRLDRSAIAAACPTSGTTVQALLRASDGGINCPDPALLAPPAFLGSFADSLPTLAADPFLQPILSDTASWPSSPSPLLRAAHDAFALLAPLLTASVTAPDASCPHQSLRARLTAPDGSLSIRLLPSASGRRPQYSFSHAFFHPPHTPTPFSPLAVDPHRPRPPPPRRRLSLAHALPDVLPAPPLRPHIERNTVPLLPPPRHPPAFPPVAPPTPLPSQDVRITATLSPPPPLPSGRTRTTRAACGATPRRHRRHDAIAKIIGDAAASNLRAHSTMHRRLSSSTGQHATKVDLVITAYDRSPSVTAIDVTISCPLLPTHSPAAAVSAAHLFDSRALEKNNKHLAGSIAQGRTFLPIVFTTLGGIGPPEAVHYLDTLFSDSYAAEFAASGSTRNTAHARRLFYQSLLATLTKATADMASALTIAAFDASAADTSSAAVAATSPPDSRAPRRQLRPLR